MIEKWIEPYLTHLAPWLLQEYGGQALWVWLALPLCFTAAYLLATLVIRLGAAVLRWTIQRRHPHFYQRYVAPLLMPLELWIGVVVLAGASQLLPLTGQVERALGYLAGTIATFAIVWALFRLTNTSGEALREHFIAHHKASAAAIIPLMRKLAKAVMAMLAVLFLLQNWGFNVGALLAGLGIGGVAIALASQKTVENLFGGVSVTLDQPVRVGDFINFGDNVGTVEDIGLRSVTIRTLQRTRVTIPNSAFAEMKLENFAARDKLLLQKTFGLRYGTTPDQIRFTVMRINELFVMHPKTENDGRARFIGFGASSLDIELFAYIRTADWNEFLAVQEDIFLRIMDIVQEAGSDFAVPFSMVRLERGEGLSPDQQAEIHHEMEQLRRTSRIFFPHVPPEEQRVIADSLPYPPPGTVPAHSS